MQTLPEHDLIKRIEAFLDASGMKPTVFGKVAIGDANLVAQLKAGRELRSKTRNRVIDEILKQQNKSVPHFSEAS